MDFATLGRAPLRIGKTSHLTSGDLQIFEATDELLEADVPEPDGVASSISLLKGFNATIPSSEQSKIRRRQMRNVDAPRLGLKRLGQFARGLIAEDEENDGHSVASEEDVVVIRQPGAGKKRGRESWSSGKRLDKEELDRQSEEILRDKENLHVRRVCSHSVLRLCFKSHVLSEPSKKRNTRDRQQDSCFGRSPWPSGK